MVKLINTPPRWFDYRLIFGLLIIFLAWGCAHKDGTARHLNASPPTQSTPQAPPIIQDRVIQDPVVQDEVSDDGDDFFEDEFSMDYSQVSDPLVTFNRVMFQFNDKFYFWCMKPIARGYRFVIPEPIRLGIGNFFYNIAGIGRMANCLLQGKFRSAGGEIGRFFVNSTVGLLGLGNPAANYPALNPEKEDLGQTLGTYGIGNGMYLVLPVFGPSTLRDTVGLVGDWFFDPLGYIRPFYIPFSIRGVDLTNKLSFHIGDYETLKDSALDPYILFRSAYIQNRQYMTNR